MKPGAIDHPKMLALARWIARVAPETPSPGAAAIGHMGALWGWAWAKTDDGDLSLFDAHDIASAAKWRGESQAFVDQLVAIRLLDRTARSLVLHDAVDHRPDYVRKRIAERARRATDSGTSSGTLPGMSPDDFGNSTRTSSPPSVSASALASDQASSPRPTASDLRATAGRILAVICEASGRKYRAEASTLAPILAALKGVPGKRDAYTEAQLVAIVESKRLRWSDDPKMQACIRPSTLFRPSHLAEYLAEAGTAVRATHRKGGPTAPSFKGIDYGRAKL